MNFIVQKRRKLLPWLACAICVLSLLYSTSYLALIWLPSPTEVDTTSGLAADYSPWNLLVFQPVDHAILADIQRERELPDQIIIDGSFWPTPTSTPSPTADSQLQDPTPLANKTLPPTSQATSSALPPNPTATRPPLTSTLSPTSTATLQKPANPSITEDSPEPVGSTITVKPPKRTPRPKNTPPPKRTETGE